MAPRVLLDRADQRLELLDQLGPPGLGEAMALTPTCWSWPSLVETEQEAAQQRPLGGAVLVLAVAGDHDVGGARVLDLEHHAAVLGVRRRSAASRRRRRGRRPRTARTSAPPRPGRSWSGSGSRARRSRGGPAPPRAPARRSDSGRSTYDSSPSASRSNATNPAGVFSASMSTRLLAGWMRSCSTSNSSRSPTATKTSPSRTQRSGSCSLDGLDQLGEVARQRLGVAAGQLHLVAVAEHDAPEPVPLRLEDQPAELRGVRDALDRLREHRPDGRHHGQVHEPSLGERPADGPGRPRGAIRGPVVLGRTVSRTR